MVAIMPLWLTFGRGLLGSAGWLQLAYIFLVAPVLFAVLLAIALLIQTSPRYKLEGLVTAPEAVLLSLSYVSIFLHGFFLVDFGDTDESVNSVATQLLGAGFRDMSTTLSQVFLFGSAALLLTALVVAMVARFSVLRTKKGASLAITACVIIGGLAAFGAYSHSHSGAAKDRQIEYDFHLMEQDIHGLASDNQDRLPTGTAQEIAAQGEYAKEFKIAERASNYTYTPMQAQRAFQLCANFLTDTTGDYAGRQVRPDDEGYHHAGYQCITYELY